MRINLSHLFLTGVHGRQQMHRRAPEAAWGGAAKCPKVSRCFAAGRCNPSPTSGRRTMSPATESQTSFVAPLEKCALLPEGPESGRQSRCWVERDVSQGGTIGADLSRQWEWRAYGDANLMTLSPSCSEHPGSSNDDRRKRRFFKLRPLLYQPLTISMELCPPAQSNFLPEWAERAGGWSEGDVGLRVGGSVRGWMTADQPIYQARTAPWKRKRCVKEWPWSHWCPAFWTPFVT